MKRAAALGLALFLTLAGAAALAMEAPLNTQGAVARRKTASGRRPYRRTCLAVGRRHGKLHVAVSLPPV